MATNIYATLRHTYDALSENPGKDLYDFITFINFAFEIYLHSQAFVRLLRIAFDLGAEMLVRKVGLDQHQKLYICGYLYNANEGTEICKPSHQQTTNTEHSKFAHLLIHIGSVGARKKCLRSFLYDSCF